MRARDRTPNLQRIPEICSKRPLTATAVPPAVGPDAGPTLEIVGALGCRSPSDVTPELLYRRESGLKTQRFSDLHGDKFPAGKTPGMLIDDAEAVPPLLREWWREGGRIHRRMA